MLTVMRMEKAGTPGIRFTNEGSAYGFRTVLRLTPDQVEMPSYCQMQRPIG
jgi:branched-chain amino acid transport system substrate-binding protein